MVGNPCNFRKIVLQFTLYGYECAWVEFAHFQVRGEHLKGMDLFLQIMTVKAEF